MRYLMVLVAFVVVGSPAMADPMMEAQVALALAKARSLTCGCQGKCKCEETCLCVSGKPQPVVATPRTVPVVEPVTASLPLTYSAPYPVVQYPTLAQPVYSAPIFQTISSCPNGQCPKR